MDGSIIARAYCRALRRGRQNPAAAAFETFQFLTHALSDDSNNASVASSSTALALHDALFTRPCGTAVSPHFARKYLESHPKRELCPRLFK